MAKPTRNATREHSLERRPLHSERSRRSEWGWRDAIVDHYLAGLFKNRRHLTYTPGKGEVFDDPEFIERRRKIDCVLDDKLGRDISTDQRVEDWRREVLLSDASCF